MRHGEEPGFGRVSRRIRILCVDDHQVVREGVAAMISRERDMEVVAAVGTGEQAIASFDDRRPDVTIMDLELPGMSGLEAIRAIRKRDPAARVVVLTMHQGDEDIYRALQAGAVTYVLKDAVFAELVDIVRCVASGQSPMPSRVATLLARRTGQAELTAREVDVLELIAKGFRNREIADTLQITEQTIKVHVRNIFAKLHVQDRTAAVSVALRRGILHLE